MKKSEYEINPGKNKKSDGKTLQISRRGFLRLASNVMVGGTVASLGGWKYLDFERGCIKNNKETFKLAGLPPSFSGLVIAHLSDPHFSTWMTPARFAEVVDQVNAESPDVVIITGDFIDGRTVRDQIPIYTALLAKLTGPKGKFAVLGNHDHNQGASLVRKILAESGFQDLSNRSVSLEMGGDSIRLCGLDSYKRGHEDLDILMGELTSDELAILLIHEPDYADISGATGRFALQLSGHSHGGQVYVPMFGPLITPSYGRKYPRGRYQVGGMQLYTNTGLGMVEPFVRFNCRPEIALISLEPESGQI